MKPYNFLPERRTIRMLQRQIKELWKTPELRRRVRSLEEQEARLELRYHISRHVAELEREIIYYRLRMPPFIAFRDGFWEILPHTPWDRVDPYEKV